MLCPFSQSFWYSRPHSQLLDMNVSGLFYNLIKDMYKISTVCMKVGQNLTDSFESSIGVRQEDVLRDA